MRWTLSAVAALALVAALAACGGDDPGDDAADDVPAATLAPAPTSTTSTTLSMEAEVEAAYLRSWDVYSDAVLTFDTSKLADVYADDALKLRLDEVARLQADNTPARTEVSHHITNIEIIDTEHVIVHDSYENHSVLLNAETKQPIEPDPNETVDREYKMRLADGTWKIWFVVAL